MVQRLSPNLRRLSAGLLLGTCLSPCPVWAVDFIVSTNADSGAGSLRQAIIDLNTTGGASNNIIVNSGVGTITLTSGDLQTVARNATVVGNNNTLSGNNQFRGLFIGAFSGTTQTAVAVSIADLTITNARAAGGNGGTRGGGGGAGLGGALFVADQASLTVSNVSLTGNAATGGAGGTISGANGGGGGMGGAGGNGAGNASGGGGGLGAGASGGNGTASGSAGIATGAASGGAGANNPGSGGTSGGGGGGGANIVDETGGGGGVGGTNATTTVGGSGGFGGGGGAGTTGGAGGFGGGGGPGETGGAGGFGGGGGGASDTAGAGGFGGGNGGASGVGGGGGGAGLGGAVFVQQGGTLNVTGAFNVTGSTATGGAAGGVQATAGSAFGSGIFIQGNTSIAFSPASGQTQTVANVIADQTGSGGTGLNAGAGAVAKSGAGTLVLSGANTYTGGTTVTGGLVNFAAGNNLGTGTITLNGGGLQWATGTSTDISARLGALGAGGGTFDTNGNDVTVSSSFAGSTGGLTKTGAGTLTLNAVTQFQGATINGGTLAVSSDNNLGAAGSGITLGGGTLRFDAAVTTGRAITLNAGGGTVDTNGNDVTLGGGIGGGGGLTKAGAGNLVLAAASNYNGGTTVQGGILEVGTFDGVTAGSLTGAISNAGIVNFNVGDTSGVTSIANTTNALGTQFKRSTSAGTATITNTNGAVTFFVNDSTAANATITSSGSNSRIGFGDNSTAGNATVITNSGSFALITAAASGGNARFITNAGGSFDISFLTVGGTTAGSIEGEGTYSLGSKQLTVGANDLSTTVSGVIADGGMGAGTGGSLVKTGSGTLTLSGNNTYTGGTTINGGTLSISADSNLGAAAGPLALAGGGTLRITGADVTSARTVTLGGGGGTFDIGQSASLLGAIGGTGGLIKSGAGTLVLGGNNTYDGGTSVLRGTLSIASDANLGAASGGLALNNSTLQITGLNMVSLRTVTLGAGGGTFDIGQNANLLGNIGGAGGLTKTGPGTLALGGANTYSGGTTINAGLLELLPGASIGTGALAINSGSFNNGGNAVTVSSLSGSGGLVLNGGSLATNSVANNTFGGAISGTGALIKQGTGTLTLTGNNTYSGGTTVSGGVLAGTTATLQGNILNNATVSFNQASSGTYAGVMSGSGGVTLQGGGVLSITGNNLYTGPTTVTGSGLVVNGSLASTVTLDANSAIGGSGTIGGLVSNGAMIAPGNSIGTLNISGNFSQNGGTYVVEANAAGQSDRINATGTATINGGTVQVIAASGNYGASTTYTILNATSGVSGTYAGVTSNFAFLTSSLSYNANNVFLTLALQGNAFSGFGGNTANQRNVGSALDQSYANASGDFATVIGALAGLSTQQGPHTLNQISGQPYADFGTFNVANNALFMNALGQQMALARGVAGSGQRQALAEACDIAACDGASPFSVWGSVLGGVGSVQGNGNSQAFTYNVGGAAAGVDYRVAPNILVGIGAGYTNGTQWVDSFQGKGWSNSVSVAAYASFTQWGLYLDALAGYAYANNQLQRQISVPGLQPRTANGSTGANQFLAQAEAGYKIGLYAPAAATVTPFARFQTSSINQAAFNEWGANSLSLNVQQQTTTSVRTVLGADLGGAIGLGDTRTLDLGLRLGWLHEYADTARPITAAFAGAPAANFTVHGASPQRDAAVIGFQASTNVAAATQLYLRYDGDIGSGTDNHALNLGVRISW